jgi:preprotein translocase subunit SecD
MQQFTRTQTAAILLTILVMCGLTVPNFVSDETIRGWPEWAHRRITLAPELQGGTSVVLEVDRNGVRERVLASLFGDVRKELRGARINLARPVTVRGGSVEVRPLAVDFEAALDKLSGLSQAFNGVRPVDVTDAGDGLIRVTPTEAGIREYEPPIVAHAIEDIRARLVGVFGLPATIEREGANRIRVQVPKHGPEAFNRMMF